MCAKVKIFYTDIDSVTNFMHSVAYSGTVHSVNMAQPSTSPGPRERTLRDLVAPDFTYDSLCIQYDDIPYVLKTGLIHLLPKFHGLADCEMIQEGFIF
ncbi:hypothetical protein Lal_00039817 [Lupinus albus]|nr:hypothetical protein Lal_00039817 [Lupinus albus]